MISLKDYAKNKGITYEAVRKQVNRYKNELDGHIQKENGTQYLDDEAVAFLDEKRSKNPVVILEQSKDEELEMLRNENKLLILKINKLQEELLNEKDQVKLLQDEKIAMLEAKNEIAVDEESKIPRWKFWKRRNA